METGVSIFCDQDVTASKDDYIEHLKNIISLMPGHVYWVDVNNVYLGCNNLQAKFFGFSSQNEIVGKRNIDLILNKEEANAIDAGNVEIMESGISKSIEESIFIEGNERVFLSNKVPLRNKNGETIGLLGVSFDITNRKKMEADLKNAKEKSEASNYIKNEFIRNIEHDIRTPISGIIGVSKYLFDKENDFEKKKLIEDIENSGKELMKYFTEVLEFTYIENNEYPVLSKRMNLESVISGVCAIELPACKNKNLRLKYLYDSQLPKVLIGDRFRIHRVLINLLSNSIKFTDSGDICVTAVMNKQINKTKIICSITVEDTGIGIEESKINILFQSFIKGSESNTGRYQGVGLGLPVVRKIVKELCGEIIVNSVPGKGTKFTINIPLKLPRTYS